MVKLRPNDPVPAPPKPKYGHLSEPVDPTFAAMREGLDQHFAQLWALPLDEFKAAWLSAPAVVPDGFPEPGKDYDVEELQVPVRDGTKLGLRLYKPKPGTESGLLVLKAHGGGFSIGSHEVEEAENRLLAAHAHALVASVDYRLAPEYKYPYAVNDCFDALKWCKANASTLGVNPEKIVVAGGSAGGNIAAVLAQMARDENVSGVVGQVLNIPVTCHPSLFPADKYEYGSYQQNGNWSIIDAPKMEWFWEQYMPNPQPEVYANPLLATDFSNLAPALIQVAGGDPLRDEGLAYAEALKAAGNDVSLEVYPGLPHGFYFLPIKQSKEYWQRTIDFVQRFSK